MSSVSISDLTDRSENSALTANDNLRIEMHPQNIIKFVLQTALAFSHVFKS